jgi:crossover junction endodeoxyribonuclease RusA
MSALIELPWPPSELSGHNDKHFWLVRPIINKHRKWAAMATLAADIRAPEGNGDIRVSATFYPPDKRSDRVNMPGRMKAYWDGIADALKVNDRRFLPSFHFAEPVKNPRVVVRIGE